jgi:hypothetical protein
MMAPAPLSDEGYSLAFASETPRTNYLRGTVNFVSVYDDNMLPLSGPGITDLKYTVSPRLELQQSRSRLRWNLTYSPGFRFYQRNSSLNGVDHNLGLNLEYRLSPHVTLTMGEAYQKASDLLYLSDVSFVQGPSVSIVPPATPKITNLSTVGMTYQYSQNAMVGVKATLSGLWYPNRPNLNGLYDSTAGSGEAFYTHRLSGRHYIGATYGFQRMFTHPGNAETETQSALLFYTLYLPPRLSISVFAGPEHSDTHNGVTLPLRKWSPAAGGSVAWHGERASFVTSYAQRIGDGGGLSGAVRSNRADSSLRWQITKNITAGVGANYSTNHLLEQLTTGSGGHAWSETASLEHPLGEHLGVEAGYTRLHQTYPNIPAIANAPNRNNVWISLSYQFERPLGR